MAHDPQHVADVVLRIGEAAAADVNGGHELRFMDCPEIMSYTIAYLLDNLNLLTDPVSVAQDRADKDENAKQDRITQLQDELASLTKG